MYELEYVRKRKRRKRAVIIGGISTIVISVFAIISFLGRFVGTFTVSLDTGKVGLTLSENSSFSTPTSYLRIGDLPPFTEHTYGDFEDINALDSDTADYQQGIKDGLVHFFKYTFYLKNVGSVDAQFDFKLNILENKLAADGRGLDNTLRVVLFENSSIDAHSKKIYGKASDTLNEEGTYCPPVSVSKEDATTDYPFEGYVDYIFESSSVITSRHVDRFAVGEVKRYTVISWLEGFRSSSEELAPYGATLKLGVEIKAYEI